jgi:hypothetical protein
MQAAPLWYLPTFHGDIRLEAKDAETTLVFVNEVTPSEVEALKVLRKRALRGFLFKPWCDAAGFPDLDREFYRSGQEQSVELRAPIDKVQAVLARALKPERALVSAVRFTDGSVEESWKTEPKPTPHPYRDPAKPAELEAAKKEEPKEEKKAEVATTVAAPVLGCPAPDFPIADVRANRVLDAFLTPDQRADWLRHGQFIVVGRDTGHRYMVTSRERKDRLLKYGGRSLYDLEQRMAMCTHDWDVPAAEEVLALKLFLELPGREHYLRSIPEDAHLGRA